MALNSYRIIETIHHSRRYLLYLAETLTDKREVVIKTQDPAQLRDLSLAESLKGEAEAGAELEHPAIRKGIGYFTEGLSGYLVAEYAAGSSLADLLIKNPEAFTMDQCLLWARDILHALHFAHSRGHQHINLNPYNIIIDGSKGLKIIGFGKSGREAWRHSEGNMNYPYPMLYVAPELFQTSNPHSNSDLYSWAVIVYQMLCRKLPWRLDGFSGPDEQKMQSLSRGVAMPDVEKVPDWLYGILISCLKSDPEERCKDSSELLDTLAEQSPDFDWTYQELKITEPEPESKDEPQTIPPESQVEILPGDDLLEEAESPADEDQTEQMEADLPSEPEREKEGEEKPAEEVETIPEESEEIPILEDSIEEEAAEETDALEVQESGDDELLAVTESLKDEDQAEQSEDDLPSEPIIESDGEEEPIDEKEHIPEETSETSIIEDSIEEEIKEDRDEPLEDREEIIEPDPPKTALDETPPPEKDLSSDSRELSAKTGTAEAGSSAKPVQKAKPAATTIQIPMAEKPDEQKDIKTMKTVFVILFILSVIFLGYMLIEHYFLQPKQELELSSEEPEIDLKEISEPHLRENLPIEMVWVPADTLIMGSISPEADDDEFPLLTVPLRGFMISSTELTQSQWSMVNESNPSLFKGADLPVENVSFYDAIEYCNAKSLKDGLNPAYDFQGTEILCDFDANGYRLPTEAEWEFAAKAGIGKNFMAYSGSDDPDLAGWYAANSGAQSHPVAGKEPNKLGLYDMSGNVCEWVWNWYAPYSYRIGNLYSGPEQGTDKVVRGGSWYHKADLMRSTARDYMKPFAKTGYIGFRVVRSR